MSLDARSKAALVGVHPDLVLVIARASENESVPFVVTEGIRSPARQAILWGQGKTRTHNSLHLDGRAVDLAVALPGGGVSWERDAYKILAMSVKAASVELGIPIEWGGEAFGPFYDGCHWQLDHRFYPGVAINLQPDGMVTKT